MKHNVRSLDVTATVSYNVAQTFSCINCLCIWCQSQCHYSSCWKFYIRKNQQLLFYRSCYEINFVWRHVFLAHFSFCRSCLVKYKSLWSCTSSTFIASTTLFHPKTSTFIVAYFSHCHTLWRVIVSCLYWYHPIGKCTLLNVNHSPLKRKQQEV